MKSEGNSTLGTGAAKKSYSRPQVVEYGDFATLTRTTALPQTTGTEIGNTNGTNS